MDGKLKHLEFVQDIIARNATNSFQLKGWTVLLVASLFVLSNKDANQSYLYLAYFPSIAFWVVDAYFLSQERIYRDLYDHVRCLEPSKIDFDLNPRTSSNWLAAFFSVTLLSFHGVILLAVTVVWWLQASG